MRILYFDIDSCRPDHLGCYGYQRPTSPVIDDLAQKSILFRQCHTSDAPCLVVIIDTRKHRMVE